MKKKIAVITGGYSGEAVISYKTVQTILKNIDRNLYEPYLIDIHPSGWFYDDQNGNRTPINKNDFSIHNGDQKITFDLALLALHGTPGEDGKLQGYFDCLNIPYTSCNTATSAITFNKSYTVAVAARAGIHVAPSVLLFKGDEVKDQQILDVVGLPVFVKPNNGGSSIGMSKVTEAKDLRGAIEKAFKEDDQVLIESFISGREFTIGVFKTQDGIIPLPITEIKSKNTFFDYEAKYEGASEEITPADISQELTSLIQNTAKKIYHLFNCSGVIRIDFIYNEEKGVPYMLEINTVPGQSEASIVPQQVRAMGWTLQQFYSSLIEVSIHPSKK